MRTLIVLVSLATGAGLLAKGWSAVATSEGRGAAMTREERGAEVFQRNCAICHGREGRGDGPAAGVLDPKPRNFALATYRLGSTQGSFPSREDVLKTVREGVPGTSMPSWSHLPPGDLEAVIDHCLSVTEIGLRERLLATGDIADERELQEIVTGRMTPDPSIEVPPEPLVDEEHLARGRELFKASCASCHGKDGAGMQDPAWRTAEGFPIASRDLRRGIFKGGRGGRSLFLRLYRGIPGTPMPSFKTLSSDEIWAVVHYVKTIIDPAGAGQPGR